MLPIPAQVGHDLARMGHKRFDNWQGLHESVLERIRDGVQEYPKDEGVRQQYFECLDKYPQSEHSIIMPRCNTVIRGLEQWE